MDINLKNEIIEETSTKCEIISNDVTLCDNENKTTHHEASIEDDTGANNVSFHENQIDISDKTTTKYETSSNDIDLREKQIPFARYAMLGRNVIMIAPTGSGKTYVAMVIVKVRLF